MPDNCPLIPTDLINYLDKLYPEKCPHRSMSDRDIWYYAGQRALVVSLMEKYKAQQEADLL